MLRQRGENDHQNRKRLIGQHRCGQDKRQPGMLHAEAEEQRVAHVRRKAKQAGDQPTAEQANRAYEQLKVQLENTQSSIWEKPMVLGSLILLAGLIFGLVLPLLIPKRRNSERWM